MLFLFYLFDLSWFVTWGTLFFSRLRRDELMSRQANKFYKSFQILQILFHLYLFVRFVQICKISVPGGTLLQSATPRNPTFFSKSSKSFFIYIYLFDLSRFVRFLCREAHSPTVSFAETSWWAVRRINSTRVVERQRKNLSKSSKYFFHHYLFVRFVQMFPEHRERGICCAPHPRWKDRVNFPTAMTGGASGR